VLTTYTVENFDKEEFTMLENVKGLNSTLLVSTTNDYERLQGRYKALQFDADQQKIHLTEALLSKDKLRQKMDEIEELAEKRQKEIEALSAGVAPVSTTSGTSEADSKSQEVSRPRLSSLQPSSVPAKDAKRIMELERLGIKRDAVVVASTVQSRRGPLKGFMDRISNSGKRHPSQDP
jgi:hypothetical protein